MKRAVRKALAVEGPLARYRKLVVAIVGLLLVVLGPDFLGVSPEGTLFGFPPDLVVQVVLAILTALGVAAVPNEQG